MHQPNVEDRIPPPGRYGSRPSWSRPVAVVATAGLAAAGLGWVVWAALDQATPRVSSRLVSYDVVSPRRVEVVVQVDRAPGVAATCRVRALAADFAVVGESTFRVPAGRGPTLYLTRTVRTAGPAVNGELVGCTAPGQREPR